MPTTTTPPPRSRVARADGDSPTSGKASRSTGRFSFGRRARIAALLVTGGLAVVALLLVDIPGREGAAQSRLPRQVSTAELRAFAGESDQPVFWAGALPGRRLELSQTADGNIFVRYLTGDALVGDGRPAFTTVGSYPFAAAYRELRRRSETREMERRPAPGNGLAAWNVRTPASVYLAYPGSDLLIEVFDPDPRRARELALSGDVGPVR